MKTNNNPLILQAIIAQFKRLGLDLGVSKAQFSLLESMALYTPNPKTGTPYSTNNGTDLIHYVFNTNKPSGSEKTVLLLSGIHPDETTPLYSAWKLLIEYLSEKGRCLIKNKIIFVPLLNSDCFIGTGEKGFIPTRIKENGIDLNRAFYNVKDKECVDRDFCGEPEIDFLLQLINLYDPSHFVILHSPLNLLELDGLCNKEDRDWVNRVHQQSGNDGGVAIPIKKFETYAEKHHEKWSFGQLMKSIQKTALTIEYPGPKEHSQETLWQDSFYRNSIKCALNLEGDGFEAHKKEDDITKDMPLDELATYAHAHYGYPSKELFVIGVTGTNGKTTVSYLIGEVLKAAGHNVFVLGTLNSGNKDLSTPEAIDTLRIMRDHLDNGGTHFVMEVTSEGIDQARVLGIEFNIKILTNITQDHLDYHKTFEHYEQTKLGFMRDGNGHKIYPKDYSKESIYFPTLLLGQFNLLNIKATAAAVRHMRIPERCIQKTLSTCLPPRGRLENVERGQLYMVVIDYAHTPDAIENVFTTMKKVAVARQGKLLALFGCGGNRDRSKRPEMGKIASEIADFVVITDDNPRSELSQDIMAEIEVGISDRFKNYELIQDRKAAIHFIINKAQANDVVVIVGKGHETYQILKSETIHFDDREEASESILLRLKNEDIDYLESDTVAS